MKFDFLNDLDDYFCEKYADYDKLCVLKGYVMPKMQTTRLLPDGREYAYTLPASTMRLADQPNKNALLASLKQSICEPDFSFSFRPLPFWEHLRTRFSKKSFRKTLFAVLSRKNLTFDDVFPLLSVDRKTWDRIVCGAYYPTKNMLYSVAFAAHLSFGDVTELMNVCGFSFDYTRVKDTVISYLFSREVFNGGMVCAALSEYKVEGLFLKS